MSEKSRRVQRVEKELRQIVSTYITRMQSGTSSDLLSVTNIVLSGDLRHAKVFVTALGKDEVSEELLESVQSHAPEMQKQISAQLRMKFCPKLQFLNDGSVPFLARMDKILQEDSSE